MSSELTAYADPNAPKRGLSAYMFFANDQRDNVREENPGISFGTFHQNPPHDLGNCSYIIQAKSAKS
jgi:hypothetical protein